MTEPPMLGLRLPTTRGRRLMRLALFLPILLAPAAAAQAPDDGQWTMPAKNPHKGDKKEVDAGGGLFVSMNCDGCHGGGATGWVGPSLADGRWRYGGADDEIFQSIFYGRPR